MPPPEPRLDPWAFALGQLTADELREREPEVPNLAPPEPDVEGMTPRDAAAHRDAYEARKVEAAHNEKTIAQRAKAALEAAATLVEGLEDQRYAVAVQGDDLSVQVTASRIVE